MKFNPIIPCTYKPGELSVYTMLRGGDGGWDFHQGPGLHPLPNGGLLMVWGAYSIHECSNDGMLLYTVSYDNGETWDPPAAYMTCPHGVLSHVQIAPTGLEAETTMIFREGQYQGATVDKRSRAVTKWASYKDSPMHLIQRFSPDGGGSWLPSMEIDPSIVIDPGKGIYYGAPESLTRLSDGSLLLLVCYLDNSSSTEQRYNCAALISEDHGRSWFKSDDFTVPERRGVMEPTIVELEPGKLFGLLRNQSGYIYDIRSDDYGRTWQPPRKTAIPTVESIARMIKLASGRLCMVWNNQSSPSGHPRHPLVAATSDDQGHTWSVAKILGDDVGLNHLSNMDLYQAADGRILVPTSHYQAQKPCCSDLYVYVFDEAWLDC